MTITPNSSTMFPYLTFLATLPLLLTITSAIPTTLNARDDRPTDQWTCGPQCSHTVFDPDQATCANNKYLKSFSTAVTVAVRPDCDTVIDTICKAADKLGQSSAPATNLVHSVGSCEGHMLFSTATADPKEVNYSACVQAFQGITESCMLSASVGKQFGVRNVMYQAVSSGENWLAGNSYQQTAPGYLIGPSPDVWETGNWGNQKEANDVLNPPK